VLPRLLLLIILLLLVDVTIKQRKLKKTRQDTLNLLIMSVGIWTVSLFFSQLLRCVCDDERRNVEERIPIVKSANLLGNVVEEDT
jgi:hypothetical protein